MKNKAFGYHYMLDLYGCDKDVIDSVEKNYEYLDNLPESLGMEKQSPPFVIYTDAKKWPDKAGISAWVPIVESGISIHTVTPTNFASIDIYSCKEFDKEKVKKITCDMFKPQQVEEKFVLRGEKYFQR